MSVLVYCIIATRDAGIKLPRRVKRHGVRLVRADGLAAVVSRVERMPLLDPDQVLAFEEVVECFHERCRSVIPIRYGEVLTNDEQLCSLLRQHAPEYRRLLKELKDACEIGIRVLPDPVPEKDDTPEPAKAMTSGTAWLESRRQFHLRRARDAARFKNFAETLRSEFGAKSRRVLEESTSRIFSMYFLVPRSRTAWFLKRAAKLEVPRGKVLVSGPWPPYSFAPARIDGSPQREAA